MRYFVLLFFFNIVAFSQAKKIVVEWKESDYVSYDNQFFQVPLAENFTIKASSLDVHTFTTTWEQESVNYVGATISNVVYEAINVNKYDNLNELELSNVFKHEVVASYGGNVVYEKLSFTPLIKTNSGYKKVVSFDLNKNSSRVISNNLSARSLVTGGVVSSILASGEWFKFKVDTTGVYQITPQFLSSLGMNLSGVDVNTIKIYGYGGRSLPLPNNENLFYDPPQIPIKLIGTSDDVFDGSDSILFYAEGSEGYVVENDSFLNPYDDDTYYYVTSGGSVSERVLNLNEPAGSVDQVFDTYEYESFYERDVFNLGAYGRRWFGERLDDVTGIKSCSFQLPELADEASLEVGVYFGAIYSSLPNLQFSVSSGGGVLASNNIDFSRSNYNPAIDSYDDRSSVSSLLVDNNLIQSNNVTASLNFRPGADITSECYLDYFSISAICKLQGIGRQFGFSNSDTNSVTGLGEYRIANAQNISRIWDITDIYNVGEKINNGSSEISFSFSGGERRYIAIDDSDFYVPTRPEDPRVLNQDLKGQVFQNSSNQFEDVDYLILTSSEFIGQANRLANFRRSNDNFNVKVVDVEDIYTEFSAGKQDVSAIRNFVKYIYDNGTFNGEVDERLRFICVLGDGSYDYKDRIPNNTNIVPLFHDLESAATTTSFATDDFYTFMDDDEGRFPVLDKMDISIGRMVARDLADASVVVDKVIRYYEEDSFGDWRNSVLFVSDDVDSNGDYRLQDKIIEISEKLEGEIDRVNVRRILTDAFVQEQTSGGERYSEASEDLQEFFQQGVSYINYLGHGGEDGITSEFIFTSETARNVVNRNRMPVFVTFTCELTRFDNPARDTAGEFLYWNSNGGAIALITTIRQIFLSVAEDLNDSLADELFDDNGLARPVGDLSRAVKNSSSRANARVVFCVGDPALVVNVPKTQIELTEINNQSLAEWEASGEALKALDRVNVKGRVLDSLTGEGLSTYSGEVTVTVFDKKFDRTTLANDGGVDASGNVVTIDFTQIGNIVFKGLASVNNGAFSIDFVLPRNVQLSEGEGNVSFYAKRNNVLEDQSGAQRVLIGGVNVNAEEDVQPPVINLFLNNESFYSGQVVGSSPTIFAKFSDENGINTAGGVGHDIIAILDGDEFNPIILNEFYEADLDDFTQGQLSYQLNELEPGEHVLELRASDVYNNPSVAEVSFIISDSEDLLISGVLNYPNPFVSSTDFWFTHNGPSFDTLEVSLQVLTVSGKVVTSKFATVSGENTYRSAISWDGKDDFGNKVGKGVYIYKITVKSTLTNKTTSKFQKLVKL